MEAKKLSNWMLDKAVVLKLIDDRIMQLEHPSSDKVWQSPDVRASELRYIRLMVDMLPCDQEEIPDECKFTTEKALNPAGEYAVKFARNRGISIEDAMEQPMVKARFQVFQDVGW